jgi:hemolysin III
VISIQFTSPLVPVRTAVTAMREPANAITHLIGSVLALGALGTVMWIGIGLGDTRALIALSIYGLSQLASYATSTLYHALRISPSGLELLLQLDCVLVFVFIAGTYTPVCLIALQAGWRWSLLGLVWGIAVGGLVMKLLWLHGPVWISTSLYVAMGWVALAALPAITQALPAASVAWFVAGGLVYTIGALIFLFDRPWPLPGVFEAHAVWHLCVLGGSCCCFLATIGYA